MNEADVREDVLAPLITELGYSNFEGAPTRIIREHPLSYPALFLGRKKPGRDLALRGTADYTLEVMNHGRWTIEAKAPNVELDADVVQQAWTYAAHPEVQAVYFVVSNGRSLRLYATHAALMQGPLLSVDYGDLRGRIDELRAFLSPEAIARSFPNHLREVGRPLAPGLKAFARIASGTISYHKSTIPLPLLSQMQVSIIDGSLSRLENGGIRAVLKTEGPLRSLQASMSALEFDVMEFETRDDSLSLDPRLPTEFVYQAERELPIGLDLDDLVPVPLREPIRVAVNAKVRGNLEGDMFAGPFFAEFLFRMSQGHTCAQSEGVFRLRLA